MIRKLVVVSGPAKGQAISLRPGSTLKLGRGQASDVRLEDPRISRIHCTVEATPQALILTDVGSTGGTYVAGRRINSHRLGSGDEFQIGETRIRFDVGDTPTGETTSRTPARISAKSLHDLAGQVLGHFKLERIIRTGGSSVLFLAKDQQQDGPAVVKVMLPTVMSDEAQRSRFVRAVHTMINVRHNNLVEVYGAGKQGPFCWCAMEYVDGITIREMIELIGTQGRLDWRSDQYGLGSTLFALLTGHPPFQSATLPDLVKQIREKKPQFPAETLGSSEQRFLSAILKMLQKSRDARFTYPSELLACLDEIGRESNVDADMLYNY